jgi:hypothetical protein
MSLRFAILPCQRLQVISSEKQLPRRPDAARAEIRFTEEHNPATPQGMTAGPHHFPALRRRRRV